MQTREVFTHATLGLLSGCVCVCVCVCVYVCVFLGPHPWHMDVPRLGVELDL